MTTLAEHIRRYRAPLLLTTFVSRRTLTRIRTTLFILTLATLTGTTASVLLFSSLYFNQWLGAAFIFFSLWVEQILIYSYHNSFYFHGLNSVLGLEGKTKHGATYEVAAAVLPSPNDLTAAFCRSSLGEEIIIRSGLQLTSVANYLDTTTRPKISATEVSLPSDSIFSIASLGQYVLKHDAQFRALLAQHAVPEHTFISTLHWVVIAHHRSKQRERWWGRDVLSRHTPLGADLAFGTTYLLERFTRSLKSGTAFSNLTGTATFNEHTIDAIETALARLQAANVLLVGEAGAGPIDYLSYIQQRIEKGDSLNAISNYHFHLLDSARLFATSRNKHELENNLLQLLHEAARAGNVILVIEHISSFIKEAEAQGVFVPELLDPYLASPELHIVATETPGTYHTHLERLGGFTRRFAEVLIESTEQSATLRILEGVAFRNEHAYGVLFTYPSLEAIAVGADRYLVEGVMPEKAVTLLADVAARAASGSTPLITSDFVYATLSEKTGIPTGPIDARERDVLLNLEDVLEKHVVGQPAAVHAVASTMRRARAGVQTSERPIGSFLFLGPTGVGKTETAKTLALVFFGNKEHMHRFDMTEYSDTTAVTRLIGSDEHAGMLASALREKPYAVVLLDEFEKAHQSVHDLMLQILDEGRFTDGNGTIVNARNTILIATSNAGSDLIMRTVAQRQELATLEDELISHIIKTGLFRPELVNRFDSTVIFEPLEKAAQTEVATLFLRELAERLHEQGYTLAITPDLIAVVVAEGYHPQFGARPMRRAVQDLVEEAIAKHIIAGDVKPGDTITLTKVDFE